MIIEFLFIIANTVIESILLLISPLTTYFTYPYAEISEALFWIVAQLKYFSGVLDLTTLTQIVRNLLIFQIAWYTFLIGRWLMQFIPLVGKSDTLPTAPEGTHYVYDK